MSEIEERRKNDNVEVYLSPGILENSNGYNIPTAPLCSRNGLLQRTILPTIIEKRLMDSPPSAIFFFFFVISDNPDTDPPIAILCLINS